MNTNVSPPSSPATVTVERRGTATWVILNRPEESNCLSPQMLQELRAATDHANEDSETRVIVYAAHGEVFCAGADLKHVNQLRAALEHPDLALAEFLRDAQQTFDVIEASPKPTIAAVSGLAMAGGLELVLSCDLVIAAETAKLGDGHARYGLLPGGGASVRLPRRIGTGRAKLLMFTGRVESAASFLGTDLVHEVTAPDQLIAAVDALATQLSSRSPLGLRHMKQLLAAQQETPKSVALAREIEHSVIYGLSSDFAEGISAFKDKRPPIFSGR